MRSVGDRPTYAEQVLSAYVICALWSSTDDDGDPLDDWATTEAVSPSALATMRDDCDAFLEYCEDTGLDLSGLSPAQIGHDFWLTRNRHGTGFWDRGLGQLGDELTEASHTFGEFCLLGSDLVVDCDGGTRAVP